MPPSTQNFGPSKLGGLHRSSSSSAFNMHHNINSDPASPRSQTILSLDSSLNSRSPRLASSPSYIDLVSSSSRDTSLRVPSRRNSGSDDCVEAHPPTPSHTSLSLTFVPPTNRQDTGEGSSGRYNVHEQQQHEDDFAWDNDDALLHFDPQPGDQNQYKSMYITGDQTIYSDESDITSTKPISRTKTRKSKTRKSASSDHSDTSSSMKKKRKKQSTRAKQRVVQDYDPPLDEEWEAKLKESIIQDKALHLRILRYEVCCARVGCKHC